jgi:8-oxo-dGTP pyrophosphatase MutT (NUDIX family)
VKGVLLEGDRVVLLLNERDEWELPGGRLERGEDPVACLEREFADELGAEIVADRVLDCWLYQGAAGKRGADSDLRGAPCRAAGVPGQPGAIRACAARLLLD